MSSIAWHPPSRENTTAHSEQLTPLEASGGKAISDDEVVTREVFMVAPSTSSSPRVVMAPPSAPVAEALCVEVAASALSESWPLEVVVGSAPGTVLSAPMAQRSKILGAHCAQLANGWPSSNSSNVAPSPTNGAQRPASWKATVHLSHSHVWSLSPAPDPVLLRLVLVTCTAVVSLPKSTAAVALALPSAPVAPALQRAWILAAQAAQSTRLCACKSSSRVTASPTNGLHKPKSWNLPAQLSQSTSPCSSLSPSMSSSSSVSSSSSSSSSLPSSSSPSFAAPVLELCGSASATQCCWISAPHMEHAARSGLWSKSAMDARRAASGWQCLAAFRCSSKHSSHLCSASSSRGPPEAPWQRSRISSEQSRQGVSPRPANMSCKEAPPGPDNSAQRPAVKKAAAQCLHCAMSSCSDDPTANTWRRAVATCNNIASRSVIKKAAPSSARAAKRHMTNAMELFIRKKPWATGDVGWDS
mmetsp:Transcript_45021/g.131085  ORF Transcript_45021/g.131085 Transcript_45021/m.131085 type:complete len:472 (-) Transcript_45021:12-1427(-)